MANKKLIDLYLSKLRLKQATGKAIDVKEFTGVDPLGTKKKAFNEAVRLNTEEVEKRKKKPAKPEDDIKGMQSIIRQKFMEKMK